MKIISREKERARICDCLGFVFLLFFGREGGWVVTEKGVKKTVIERERERGRRGQLLFLRQTEYWQVEGYSLR